MRTLIALGIGAFAMYLLDPDQGRRRRALMRDKWLQGQKRLKSQPAERPAETPPSAHHLGR